LVATPPLAERGALPTPRSARASARGALVACQSLDLPDSPFLREEVHLYKEATRQRVDEFRGIFVSRNASEVEELRERLQSLDREEVNLKETIARLREELEEANRERLAKDPAGGDVAALGATIEEDGDDDESFTDDSDEPGEVGDDAAGAGDGAPRMSAASSSGRFRGMSKLYHGRESLSPILNRRRAEVRFREAELAHEQSLSQMKTGMTDVNRRMRKQAQFMQRIDQQILETELHKVKYKVRSEKAELRIKSLSKELSQAYDKVVGLLDERLRAEDAKAQNDALVAYLGTIRKEDLDNEAHFVPNRAGVLELLDRFQRRNNAREALDVLEAEVANKIQLGRSVEGHVKKMLRLSSEMQHMWSSVPTAMREVAFIRGRGASTDLHPSTAVMQINESLAVILDSVHKHTQAMMKFVSKPIVNTEPAVITTTIQVP